MLGRRGSGGGRGGGLDAKNVCSVEIRRDGLSAPWGFRMKGGKDVEGGTPLEIVKVSIGSGSEGLLHVGDKVVGIQNQNTKDLTHLEAQNIIKNSGTSITLNISRPGLSQYSQNQPSSSHHPQGQKMYNPSSSAVHSSSSFNKPSPQLPQQSPPQHAMPQPSQGHGQGQGQSHYESYQPPFQQNYHPPPTSYPANQSKMINVGGHKKEVVTKQFNSPLNLYSDETIADAAHLTNRAQGQSSASDQSHPGYVHGSKPHLPTPKDATFSRPQQSETFKLILESEMDKARDQKGIISHEFQKQTHNSRPSSSMSNKSQPDPVLMDSSINQSASFKKLMHSVLGEDEF